LQVFQSPTSDIKRFADSLLAYDSFRDFSRLRSDSHGLSVHVSDAIKAQSSNLPMYGTIHAVMPLCVISF